MIELLASAYSPILPVPEDLQAGDTVGWLFTLWAGGFAFLVLPYCIYRLWKKSDSVPLLVWLGGFLISVGEPMLDHLGHLWWPTDLPGPAFSGFALNVPALIPPCYVFFVAMTGYWAYRRFQAGITIKGVFLVWLAVASTDLLLEYPGVIAGAYVYYGDQPFEFFDFPWWWAWINGTAMLAVGFLLHVVVPHLQGRRKALILILPTMAFLGSYGMTAWPDFMALNWEMADGWAWALSAFSLALCLLVVRGIAAVVATDSNVVVPGLAPPSAAPLPREAPAPAPALVGSPSG